MAVALLPRTDELYFLALVFHLSRSEVLEDANMRSATHSFAHSLCHFYATADHHHVNILRGAFEEQIPHIAAYDIGLDVHLIGHFAYQMKDGCVQQFCQFSAVQVSHYANQC